MLGSPDGLNDEHDLRFIAEALQLAVFDLLDEETRLDDLRTISERAFQMMRVLPRPESPLDTAEWLLRVACLGVLGERWTDAARLLRENPWPELPTASESWDTRVYATTLDIWLRLIRKNGWVDLDRVQEQVLALREAQQYFEAQYLENGTDKHDARASAWRLVSFYHLAKAAEVMALYSAQGEVEGHYDIRQQLQAQFDRALSACTNAGLIELENLSRLLARTAIQLADNSIWTVTRAATRKVSQFVETLISRNNPRPIFEMLPPQRRVLREEGLLGSGHRAVVINLPTSSGKTFIAQFRILQALNQFEVEQGWVAYLAPTRTLVNQVSSRLRRDFAPLGVTVERVSPALEVDALEASLLTDRDEHRHFRVLVTTPEKLDLMLRGGWEEKIGRPVTLVVVDEAHNLAQKERGVKLELLLATINRECRNAQFLLLTPFIQNAEEIARWLSPDSYRDFELSLDWQPNDKAICLVEPRRGSTPGSFTLDLSTIHTNRSTLYVPETLPLSVERPLGLGWSQVARSPSKLAAATAQSIKMRGPVIILVGKVSITWSLADTFKCEENRLLDPSPSIRLAQRFFAEEFGHEFPLVDLLNYGVGVHHAGLSDEAKVLMEWLLEEEQIQVLVATTTIAQGVNFPVSGVVLATHQYALSEPPYWKVMPPEDFWNLAGRAGRVDQGSLGIVALAATNEEKAEVLREFATRNVASIHSALIEMVQQVMEPWSDRELRSLFYIPEWSSFLQYLAHTYRQIGNHERFALEIEQVLRGTLGFEEIRRTQPRWAKRLIAQVRTYAEHLSGKPLKLVDETGFSWESVSGTLQELAQERITENVWDPDELFTGRSRNLQKMMGILLKVPELRENLIDATGGPGPDGALLARIVADWVNGVTLEDIAQEHYSTNSRGEPVDPTTAMTNCCRSLFGKLAQTASWGLAALQTLTFREDFERLSVTEQQTLRNLPARVFYGVDSDDAVGLRLLGVPRRAAEPLSRELSGGTHGNELSALRAALTRSDASTWVKAMGASGDDYYQVWKILEGNPE
jgi:DEAD/DEAH box helicase